MRCFSKYILLSLVVLISSCSSSATQEDMERLKRANEKWGDKYEFWLAYSSFVGVKPRPGTILTESEVADAAEILFEPRNLNPDSNYRRLVYLNVYDANGKFQYQLFAQAGRIGKGFEEYQ